jgi:hypothetical protein
MGDLSFGDFLEQYGGVPEPGEYIPDFDAIRDAQKEQRAFGVARAVPPYGRPYPIEHPQED